MSEARANDGWAPYVACWGTQNNPRCVCVCVCRLFGTKCDKCGDSFHKNDYVMRAKTKIYHVHCFKCSVCSRKLLIGKCTRAVFGTRRN